MIRDDPAVRKARIELRVAQLCLLAARTAVEYQRLPEVQHRAAVVRAKRIEQLARIAAELTQAPPPAQWLLPARGGARGRSGDSNG
jgi:hypothetical protein